MTLITVLWSTTTKAKDREGEQKEIKSTLKVNEVQHPDPDMTP